MKDSNGRKRREKPRSDASEIGEIRVFANPGPDAEDRLRRLFSLMVKYATRNGEAAQEKSITDDRPNDKPTEAEA